MDTKTLIKSYFLNSYAILYFLVGILATLVTVRFKPLDFGIIAIPPSS